ncbi:phage holin family protein [Shimia sagamensis]|uniref:4 TMS phage holin, superfamily IV n=1 Tax=Shimia sagamensis TaxID=1566352 RepID=A0ABY1NDP1_9RHOB|nr:phage holin family protein [Shimia sagamensis]SMP07166.1 4 TMS phage holin, superfamily IV [Shimia sagamensis]
MPRFVLSAAAHLIANAVGLMLATVLLEGFNMSFLAMVIVVLVFTVVSVVLLPVIRKISEKKMPELLGGLSLIVTFAGLLITELLVSGFSIGGIPNLLAATLIVWLGALIAGVLVPKYLFPSLATPKAQK